MSLCYVGIRLSRPFPLTLSPACCDVPMYDAADIIARSATEIVKNCFGDDSEEAKNLPWTREQAWFLVKKLSKDKEVCASPRPNALLPQI